MEKVKQIPKKFLAMILSFVLLISAIPFGVFSVFAAGDDCIATEVNSTKVYFYGIDALETKELTVKYEGGEGSIAVFVGGTEVTADTGVSVSGRSVTFDEDWLDEQTDWIAVKCNSTASIPSSEPSVDVDNTAPVISGLDGNPTEWAKSATLTVNSTDTDIYSYSIDKIDWQSEKSFTVTENENYSLYVKDKSGNISDAYEITVDKIDTIPPTISSVSIDPNTWTNQTVIMEVTASDEAAGLHENAYKMDDGEWQNSNAFAVSDSEEHIFYVRDALENVQSTTAKADKHDAVAPVISNINVSWNSIPIASDDFIAKNVTYTVKIEASDAKSGINAYSTDNSNWQESNEFSLKGKDINTFYVRDNAGNVSQKSISPKYDDTAPVIESATPDNTEPTNQAITYTITASDSDSGIGGYKLDETGSWQNDNTLSISDDKEHTIYVRDKAKPEPNVSTIKVRATNFCDKKPTVDSISNNPSSWTNGTITLTVSATGTENSAGTKFPVVAYKMDNGEWQESNVFTVDDAASHIFYVKDTATNESKAYEYATKNYDKKVPELNNTDTQKAVSFTQKNDGNIAAILNKLSFGHFFNKTLVITVNAKDVADENNNASGVSKASFIFVDSESKPVYEIDNETIEGNKEDVTCTFEVKNDDLPKNFKGTAKVVLTDAAGNEQTYDVITKNSDMADTDFMIENDAPVISNVETGISTGNITKSNFTLSFDVDDRTDSSVSGIAFVSVKVNGKEVNGSYVEGQEVAQKVTDTTGKAIDYQETEYKDNAHYTFEVNADDYSVNGVKLDDWNNGQLKFEISACDNAGNYVSATAVEVAFDQTAPVITKYDVGGIGAKSIEKDDTYGFYFKENTTVTITAEDFANTDKKEAVNSGVKSITVYLEDKDGSIYVVTANNSTIKKATKSDIVAVDTDKELTFTIPANFKGQIYAYATDNAENYPPAPTGCKYFYDETANTEGYANPDGSIVENAEKHKETSSIKFTKIPTAQGTQNTSSEYKYSGDATNKDAEMDYEKNVGDNNVPLYNKDIEFDVTVSDTYSGIKEITYTIFEGKEETVKTVKLDNTGKIDGEANGWSVTNTDSNLATEMTNTIAVSGNYNDMVLLVELTDRAGNTSYDYYVFGIDKTAPTISVRYNNNKGDSQSGTGTYFDNHRKATVVITERNFNTENVKWTIKNDEGKAPSAKLVSTKEGTGNKDNTTYTYEINYNYDGVFSFDVSYTDRATNKNTAVDYGNSLAPKAFVVDTVNPTITVSYNNNSAQNEKYFKEYRTATVTIVEHNFDVNRVKFTMTAALSGSAKAIPAVSWNHSGDTHVATINYNSDGDYTFDITMEDKSGRKEETVNYGNSVAAKDFVIDTTYSDIVKVDGVANGDIFGLRDDGSINDAAEIKITFNDVNFDKYSIHLYRNRVLVDGISENANSGDEYEEKDVITTANKNAVENDADVTEEFIGSVANGNSNTTVTFDIPAVDENKVKNDGMYTLRIEANDKAGNAYDTNSNVITFAVNRYGSVYTVDDDLYNLINDNEGYTQAIAGDIVIREYNTTDVTTNKLSILRGTTPLEGVECKPAAVSQTGVEWHEYAYKVDKSYFMDGDKYIDGEYSLIISSTDKADIKSTNDKYDTCQVGFVLDTTAPKINGITPSAESKNISLDNYLEIASDEDVTFTVPVTDNLRLSTVEIFIGDTSDDATPAYVYTYKGDKVEVNTDKGGTFNEQTRFDDCSFTLSPGTSRQNFRVIVTDKVGLTVDTADFESGKVAPEFEGFFNEVLITSNWFVRMWNRPVFKIALGSGLLAALAASIFIIIAKKRKKDDDEEQPQAAE